MKIANSHVVSASAGHEVSRQKAGLRNTTSLIETFMNMNFFVASKKRLGLAIACYALLLSHFWSATAYAQESPAALSGFEPAEIFDVNDGGSVSIDDEVLTRLLMRCFQVSDKSFLRAAKNTASVTLKDARESPRDYRFYSFRISGTARSFESYPVENDDLLLGGFHLLHVTDDSGDECLVALPILKDASQLDALPGSWTQGERLEQQISFAGFFVGLRSFEGDEDTSISAPDALQNKLDTPLFVARRIKWYPKSQSKEFAIEDADLILAAHGVDFNQLRQVGKNRSSRIGADEAMSFYQVLHATSKIDASDIGINQIELETMLREPGSCLGKPVSLTGHVRRITEIPVEDEEIRQSLGIEKYYQLDLFVPLDNRKIVIKPPAGRPGDQGASDLVIENRFPVTICTCSLPMDKDQINRNRISIRGFFFKNWSYESELSIESQSGAQQIAPLIIALEPKIAPLGVDYFSGLLTAFAIVVLLGALLLAWFMRPGKSSSLNRTTPDRIEVPDFEN